MRTPGIDERLEKIIRTQLADYDWKELAEELGCTVKEINHMLNFKSPRHVTAHFIGLLAIREPYTWNAIAEEYYSDR